MTSASAGPATVAPRGEPEGSGDAAEVDGGVGELPHRADARRVDLVLGVGAEGGGASGSVDILSLLSSSSDPYPKPHPSTTTDETVPMTAEPTSPAPRAVLVTGASRGIGRAVARAFAEQGDHVAVHVRSAVDEGEATLASLRGSGHALVRADLGDPAEANGLAAAAEEALGQPVEVLVNNAGIATTPTLEHSPATTDAAQWQRSWEDYLRINTLGTAMVTRAMTSRLIELGLPGRVITIGTRGVHRGEPDFPAYAASKAALHSMDASLAVALAPHDIGVATVAPGFVETERVADRLDSPAGESIRSDSPFGRVGRPEEVAAAVLWLASPEAVWASGATLDLNGASYLRP